MFQCDVTGSGEPPLLGIDCLEALQKNKQNARPDSKNPRKPEVSLERQTEKAAAGLLRVRR